MRIFAILALVIGVFMAGGAVKYMYDQFRVMEARYNSMSGEEPVETVMIAVAAENLRYGTKIGAESVKLVRWPAEAAPETAFNTIEELFQEEGAQRTVLRHIEEKEVILRSKVTGFGEDANVAALLRPGMRAHTLGVDTQSSVAGFIFPGSQVDIYLTYNGASGQRTKLLMEKAEIIAVDQTTDREKIKAQAARTVTLEVTPQDSQRLILAERIGQLSFNLRGLGDNATIASAGGEPSKDLSVRELLGIEEEVVEEVQERGTVVVRRGGTIGESVEIDENEPAENETDAEGEDEKKEQTSN